MHDKRRRRKRQNRQLQRQSGLNEETETVIKGQVNEIIHWRCIVFYLDVGGYGTSWK